MPALLWIIKYWKPIVTTVIVATLISALIGLGMHYQELKGKQDIHDKEVKRLEQIIETNNKEILTLKDHVVELKRINNNYVVLLSEIQKNRVLIQAHYNLYMEKIKNAEIPLNEKGTLSEPYIVIPSGVPSEAKPTSSSGR